MKNLLSTASLLFFTLCAFSQSVTYSNKVAGIIYNNCTTCHRSGALAPFSLENYKDAYSERYSIMSAVQSKVMPPWSPDPKYSRFAHEIKLSDDDINAIANWVSNGAERGDSTTEPVCPQFADKSQLPSVDYSKRCDKYTVAKPLDDFHFFVLPSGLTQDALISKIELLPGNKKIVHHIFVFIDSTGNFAKSVENGTVDTSVNTNYVSGGNMNSIKLIGGYLPGANYYSVPDAFTFRVPANSYYIVQIHYAPGHEGESDSTILNLQYSKNTSLRPMDMQPLLDASTNLVNGPLEIAANSTKTFYERFVVPNDISLISITPHMHLIGKRMKVYALDPVTADTIKLIDDYWNFHWQGMYTFPKAIHLKANDIIFSEGTYENTTANTDNPNNPPQQIVAGNSTLKEMMQVFFCFVPYQEGDENMVFDSAALSSGIASQTSNEIIKCSISPNPVNSGANLMLDIQQKGNYNTSIYAMDGRMVSNYMLNIEADTRTSIQLPELNSGVYILKMTSTKGVITKKILVN